MAEQAEMVNHSSSSKPHLAFLASPGMGHITPLLQLALTLVTQHNIHVTFLVITAESTPAQTGFLNANSNPDLHILHLPTPDMSAILRDDMTVVSRLCAIVEESIRPLPSILSRLNRPKLKAFVIDIFCTGVFDICRDLSIPVYSFFTASTAFMALSLYLPTLMDKEVEGKFFDHLQEPAVLKVPGCNPIGTQDSLDKFRNYRKIDEIKCYLLHVSRLSLAAGIFVNSWNDLEPVALNAVKKESFFLNIPTPPVFPIGPLTKQTEPGLDGYEKEIIEWLDNQPKDSVLFVSFGSGGTLTHDQLTELAHGLEMSKQRFIFVVRKPSDSSDAAFFGTESNLDDPRAYLPDGFVERTNRVGLVVCSWAPQVAVLSHSSTGAFLSHCGWNSTLESLNHGVPMIGWPMYAEQRMNATILSSEVGVAMKVPVVGEGGETVLVGRKEIERVVRMVMEGEEGKKMRRRARELEASGREALSPGGSSYEAPARVVESWKSETDSC